MVDKSNEIMEMLINRLKENVSHQVKLDRSTRDLSQKQAAKYLEVSERTLQRIEDPKNLDCSFSSAFSTIATLASLSEYSIKDWFLKVCCPDDSTEFRTQFTWEKELLSKLNEINQSYRRIFTSNIKNCESKETLELCLLLAALLMSSENKKALLSLLLQAVALGDPVNGMDKIVTMVLQQATIAFKDSDSQ